VSAHLGIEFRAEGLEDFVAYGARDIALGEAVELLLESLDLLERSIRILSVGSVGSCGLPHEPHRGGLPYLGSQDDFSEYGFQVRLKSLHRRVPFKARDGEPRVELSRTTQVPFLLLVVAGELATAKTLEYLGKLGTPRPRRSTLAGDAYPLAPLEILLRDDGLHVGERVDFRELSRRGSSPEEILLGGEIPRLRPYARVDAVRDDALHGAVGDVLEAELAAHRLGDLLVSVESGSVHREDAFYHGAFAFVGDEVAVHALESERRTPTDVAAGLELLA